MPSTSCGVSVCLWCFEWSKMFHGFIVIYNLTIKYYMAFIMDHIECPLWWNIEWKKTLNKNYRYYSNKLYLSWHGWHRASEFSSSHWGIHYMEVGLSGVFIFVSKGCRGGPDRMGSRPPPWLPLIKSYDSSILSTSLGSKTLNTSTLGLGGIKIKPFGSYFDVIFLMYLGSSGVSFKPTSSSSSSSSTQFSQEWVSVQKGGHKTFNKSMSNGCRRSYQTNIILLDLNCSSSRKMVVSTM